MTEFLLSQERLLFVLLRPSNDRMGPTHLMEGNLLLSKPTDLNVNLIKNTFAATPKLVFDQIAVYHNLTKLTYKINHHR